METKINIYYAHSMRIFGTEREKDELEFLRQTFPNKKVICPFNDIGDLPSLKNYLNIVDKCQILVASEYKNHVGRGVYYELARHISNEKTPYVLRTVDGKLTLLKVAGIRRIENGDTAVKYGKIIIK